MLSNSWLKYLKLFLLKFLTELSNEEHKNLKLSIKLNLLLLNLIYFSNPFDKTFILQLDFSISYIIRWESYFLGCGIQQEFCELI